MKAPVSIALTFVLMASLFAGCGGGASSTASTESPPASTEAGSSSEAAPASTEKVPVQLWHYHTVATAEYLEKTINEYNALPEGKAIVTPQYLPRNDLLKRYTLGVVSNDLPEIAFTDNPDAASFAAMGMFIDITERTAAMEHPDYLEGPINSGKYDGKQFTLPIRSNCLALWSNNEKMTAAGVTKMPDSWDELLAVCEQLKTADPNVYPLALCAGKTEEGTFQFLPFLLSAGATWDTMDSPEAAKALTYLKTLYDSKYISAEVINWTQNDVEKQFASGNCAMMVNGCWHIASMVNDAPDMAYTISNIPKDQQYATSLGGENIGMTKAATGKEDETWDFINWFLSLDTSIAYNSNLGTISPNKAATLEMQYPDDVIMGAFFDQIEFAVARGPHPKWPEISGAVQDAIQQTLTGAKDAETAGKDAAAKITEINNSVK